MSAQTFKVNLDAPRVPTVAQAAETTKGIITTLNIGDLWYNGTTLIPGSTTDLETNAGLDLQCTQCINPVGFSNIEIFVKGFKAGTGQPVTTGPTCGTVEGATAPPCEMGWSSLPTCGHRDWKGNLVEDCITIAIQLVSPTGKNFLVPLQSGQNFCADGITNVVLAPEADQAALDPACDVVGEFCSTVVSTPINLHAAPASSCD
jgi:hypothetical protein